MRHNFEYWKRCNKLLIFAWITILKINNHYRSVFGMDSKIFNYKMLRYFQTFKLCLLNTLDSIHFKYKYFVEKCKTVLYLLTNLTIIYLLFILLEITIEALNHSIYNMQTFYEHINIPGSWTKDFWYLWSIYFKRKTWYKHNLKNASTWIENYSGYRLWIDSMYLVIFLLTI